MPMDRASMMARATRSAVIVVVPEVVDRSFRRKWISDSGGSGSLIPDIWITDSGQVDQGFRSTGSGIPVIWIMDRQASRVASCSLERRVQGAIRKTANAEDPRRPEAEN